MAARKPTTPHGAAATRSVAPAVSHHAYWNGLVKVTAQTASGPASALPPAARSRTVSQARYAMTAAPMVASHGVRASTSTRRVSPNRTSSM
jgi:hypothetical protein